MKLKHAVLIIVFGLFIKYSDVMAPFIFHLSLKTESCIKFPGDGGTDIDGKGGNKIRGKPVMAA